MSGKTYASNKQLGLNKHGIKEQIKHKGIIPPSVPGSIHHVASDGGWMRPHVKQTGWRVRCGQIGSCGGYEISINNHHITILPGTVDQVDFIVDEIANIKVEHIGMLSNDWGALVISRVF